MGPSNHYTDAACEPRNTGPPPKLGQWMASHSNDPPFTIFYSGPKDAKKPDGEQIKSWVHPTLGPLPPDYSLCYVVVDKKAGKREPRYWNAKTNKATKENPRFLADILKARQSQKTASIESRVGSSIVKNKPGLMEKLHRADIGTDPALRDQYEIVHTIDDGKGGIGGMNGGVHIVRLKGFPQLYVEKRFKPDYWHLVRREVEMVHRVRHGAITLFCSGFVDDKTRTASLICEYCDRGSWEDIIKHYRNMRMDAGSKNKPYVPERFIWHAFLGIADAFAYLQGGRSYLPDPIEQASLPVEGWMPILHRDMKPDNVLMRSRATLGANKYFYCILTDFGVACNDDGQDDHQKNGGLLGTQQYQPPELLYDPYPKEYKGSTEHILYPMGARHSGKSDIWSLGASIYNLCKCDGPMIRGKAYRRGALSHLTFDKIPEDLDVNVWMMGRASRINPLELPNEYSAPLNDAVLRSTLLEVERPDAIALVKDLKWYMEENKIQGTGPVTESDKLPDWCYNIHDHYTRMPGLQ